VFQGPRFWAGRRLDDKGEALGTGDRTAGLASIVVVESESAARARVAAALRQAGHDVREASDADEALILLDAAIPDLLIVHIPGQAGPALLGMLRTHPIRAAMAILGMAGHAEAAALLEAGADDVLALPLNLETLKIKAVALGKLKQGERAARELAGRQARDQQLLRRAERRLAACTTIDDALTVTAELVRANLGYDRVSIAHYDAPMLRYVIGTDEQGRIYSPIDPPVSVNLREGSALRDLPVYQAIFVQGQETYYIPDTADRIPAYFRPFLNGPVRESLLVALRAGERVVGLITVDNLPSARKFGPEDSGLLVTLAHQAGLAVERAGQSQALQARAEDAEALARAGIAFAGILDPDRVVEVLLDQAQALFTHDFVAVLLSDDDWARIAGTRCEAPLADGAHVIDLRGLGGAALAKGDTLYVPDVKADPVWRDFPLWSGEQRIRAIMLAPLVIAGEARGVLCLAGFQARAYDARRRDLIGALADCAAGALHTARLFQAEKTRADSSSAVTVNIPRIAEKEEPALVSPVSSSAPSAEPEQTQRMIDNLRLLTVLDLGMLRPTSEPVNISALPRRATANDQGLQTRLILNGPDEVRALADPGYAAHVLENLIENASRYSPVGSPIHVNWTVEGRMAVIRVMDEGRGIPAAGRDRLFARFGWSPADGANPAPHGVGLGLYLGRALAEAMGGALDLELTDQNGSTFRLSLPLLPD
jgi:GAF domain-containing protein/ActR/RegA family two-component response regulator